MDIRSKQVYFSKMYQHEIINIKFVGLYFKLFLKVKKFQQYSISTIILRFLFYRLHIVTN